MRILFLILFLNCSIAFSQIIIPEFIATNKISADKFIGNDALGSYYFIKNSVLFKNDHSILYEYKNLELGKPNRIDINNPMKIVLFYENFNAVVTLDNQLNETQKVNFSEFENPINATALGLSSRNSFWIFNILENKLGLFDYLKKEYKPISAIISQRVKLYDSDFNYFYYLDDKNDFYSCNIFGKIKFLKHQENVQKFVVVNDQKIIYKSNDALIFLNLSTNETQEIKISEKTILDFCYKNQILSIFTNQEVNTYKINLE